MRSTLILASIIAALFTPSVSMADGYDDCRLKCAGDKDSCVMNCPMAIDSSDQTRAQCVQDCQDAYNACIKSCPASSSAAPGTSSMAKRPMDSALRDARVKERNTHPGASRPPVSGATQPATRSQKPLPAQANG